MIRAWFTAFALLAAPAVHAEDIDLSPLLANGGLESAQTALAARAPDPARGFALGGVRFLMAIEKTLQKRYRQNAQFDGLGMPILRLPLPPNLSPEPLRPDLVTSIFADLVDDMQAARIQLADADDPFGVTLDVSQVWFDINENGKKDRGEALWNVAAAAMGLPTDVDGSAPLVIRFDLADAAWLTAYTHLLEGVGHLVLAFDPTQSIAEVGQSNARMQALQGGLPPDRMSFLRGNEAALDLFATVYGALRQQPDADHTRQARQSWLQAVGENRRFWERVAAETDDDREWIPNAAQTSALGIALPEGTSERWLNVLSDAEAVLNGDLLVEHWRVAPGAGVNVARLMDNPVPVDIVSWVQGHGLLNYMEQGPLVQPGNLQQFQNLVGGDSILFMLWLN